MDHLRAVGRIVHDIRRLGLTPVLVGGMALVVLGSRRVTQDFDFVVADPADRLDQLMAVLYGHDLELASRTSKDGKVMATIDTPNVATLRVKIDKPSTIYLLNRETGLRVDLLFDFPLPAAALAGRATRLKVRGHVFDVASEPDLIQLKQIARKARTAPGDAEDLAFLKARRGRTTPRTKR